MGCATDFAWPLCRSGGCGSWMEDAEDGGCGRRAEENPKAIQLAANWLMLGLFKLYPIERFLGFWLQPFRGRVFFQVRWDGLFFHCDNSRLWEAWITKIWPKAWKSPIHVSLAQSVQVVIRVAYLGRSRNWTRLNNRSWLVRYRIANNALGFFGRPKLGGHSQITMDYLVATKVAIKMTSDVHSKCWERMWRPSYTIVGRVGPCKREAKWNLNRKTGGWFKQILFLNCQSLAGVGNKHIRNSIGLWLKSISFHDIPFGVRYGSRILDFQNRLITDDLLMILKWLKPVVPIQLF